MRGQCRAQRGACAVQPDAKRIAVETKIGSDDRTILLAKDDAAQ